MILEDNVMKYGNFIQASIKKFNIRWCYVFFRCHDLKGLTRSCYKFPANTYQQENDVKTFSLLDRFIIGKWRIDHSSHFHQRIFPKDQFFSHSFTIDRLLFLETDWCSLRKQHCCNWIHNCCNFIYLFTLFNKVLFLF